MAGTSRTASAARERVPVTVLTGFLGSGKTTILARLARVGALSDAAVILNEFGEVGLDHLLLEASGETVVDLSCGCVCCTIRGDLVATLADLRGRAAAGVFRRVVLETTGLADPAPVVHTFMQEPSVFENYRLAGVVTAVDAANAMATLDGHPEAVKQVALADELAITKTDVAGPVPPDLEARLARINPRARRSVCVDGDIDPAAFAGDPGRWPEAVHADPAADAPSGSHGDGVATFVVSRRAPLGRGALAMFLQLLADQKGADLLRVKGLALVSDDPSRPLVVHGVQHVVHPGRRLGAWPPGTEPATALVFVVRGVDRAWVEALLDRTAASPYAAVT